MDQIFVQIREILVSALAAAMVSLVALGWKYLKSFIEAKINQVKSKTQSDLTNSILDRILVMCDEVSTSFDPIAYAFKKANEDGKLTAEEIKQIQDQSQEVVTQMATEIFSKQTLIEAGLTDEALAKIIATGIEASLQRRKYGNETKEA